MLFVVGALRHKAIHKSGSSASADKLLEMIAHEWIKTTSLKQVILIFDHTGHGHDAERFRVCSARPHFQTSDDALVYWNEHITPEEAKEVVVFTSDRELNERLQKCGVQVFKSKAWYEVAAKVLGRKEGESLDDWADRWIAEKTQSK
jgi:hypothetical protein